MKCENCTIEHDGSYGSGRFCSLTCSRSFSTKAKRIEINKAVSKKLKTRIDKFCIKCNSKLSSRNKSGYCMKHVVETEEYKNSLRKPKSNTKNMGGLREGGGRSKVIEYNSPIAGRILLNKDEIKVAKVLDLMNVKWERNYTGFEYKTIEGKKKKYYPDFYINDINLYVEYKGWVNPTLNHKMSTAVKKNRIKLKIIYSNDKRYNCLGLSLKEFEMNPAKLFENI